jgi:hypothetical protein
VVIANATNVAGASTTLYDIVDGVAVPINDPSIVGQTQFDDVQGIVDAAPVGTIIMTVLSNYASNPTGTYIIQHEGSGGADDIVFSVANITTAIGFGVMATPDDVANPDNIGAGASMTIDTDNAYTGFFANVEAQGTDGHGNGDTAAGGTFDDGMVVNSTQYALYAIDNLNVSNVTNTYNNLANYALLEVGAQLNPFDTGAGVAVSNDNVTVQQLGSDPILDVIINHNAQLNSLNVDATSDNPLLALYLPETGNLTIGTITDPGTAIAIIGADQTATIGAITDANLTTIDASLFSGYLSLGTEAAPLTQAGLHITYGTVDGGTGDVIFASGAGDVITAGDEAVGNTIIQAAGAGDTINVDITDDAGSTIGASGTGDTLNLIGGDNHDDTISSPNSDNPDGTQVWGGAIGAAGTKDSAYDIVYDTLSSDADHGFIVPTSNDSSLGANTTVNIGDPSDGGADTTAVVWLGANNKVSVDCLGDTVADLLVTGDFTGATTSAVTGNDLVGNTAFAHEQITWSDGEINLYFGNEAQEYLAGGTWQNSEVNVGEPGAVGVTASGFGATTLAQALDIAAAQVTTLAANLNDFTGITTASGVAQIQAGVGLVDWFEWDGNTYIVEANNSTTVRGATGTPAAETHSALGTHDVVIEIIGVNSLIPGLTGVLGFNSNETTHAI